MSKTLNERRKLAKARATAKKNLKQLNLLAQKYGIEPATPKPTRTPRQRPDQTVTVGKRSAWEALVHQAMLQRKMVRL